MNLFVYRITTLTAQETIQWNDYVTVLSLQLTDSRVEMLLWEETGAIMVLFFGSDR